MKIIVLSNLILVLRERVLKKQLQSLNSTGCICKYIYIVNSRYLDFGYLE